MQSINSKATTPHHHHATENGKNHKVYTTHAQAVTFHGSINLQAMNIYTNTRAYRETKSSTIMVASTIAYEATIIIMRNGTLSTYRATRTMTHIVTDTASHTHSTPIPQRVVANNQHRVARARPHCDGAREFPRRRCRRLLAFNLQPPHMPAKSQASETDPRCSLG